MKTDNAQGGDARQANDPQAVDLIAGGLKNRGDKSNQNQQQQRPETVDGGGAGDSLKGGGAGDHVDGDRAGELTPQEEIKSLRDRLAKMEAEQDGRQSRRDAEDARDTFIRENVANGIPRELARMVLPATKDQNALFGAKKKLEGWVKEIIDAGVASGHLKHVPIGGSAGGKPPTAFIAAKSENPVDLIDQGLKARGQ